MPFEFPPPPVDQPSVGQVMGAYEVGNVRVCLAEENRAERNQNYTIKGEKHPNYGKTWLEMTSHPDAARAKMSRSGIIAVARRTRNVRGRFVPAGASDAAI